MKPFSSISLVLFFLFASSGTAQIRNMEGAHFQVEHRVALVIGNTAYETSPLLNSVNDARDIAQALKQLGFAVVLRENLSQKEMNQEIKTFGEGIHQGVVGLFYFAGHAVQVNGHDYLIPVANRISCEAELEDQAVDIGLVLTQMENAKNGTNIVILDACRDNPFPRNGRPITKRLATSDAPAGTLIAYATAPGAEASDGRGRNGVYTQALLKAMRTPGLNIEEVFKRVRVAVQQLTGGRQTPWESSSLVNDFYFSPIDEKWMEGRWEGTAYQGNAYTVRPIKLAVQNNAYAIDSPALTCRTEWMLLQSKNGKATLREKKTNGLNQCEEGGEVVLEKISGSQIVFKYFSPQANEIIASGILNKLKEQAQRILP